MKNTFGNSISITLFGESHGEEIGVVLDGMAPGIPVREEEIRKRLALRRPAGRISTSRVEADEFRIVSGVLRGKTTGAPICILIPNTNTKSQDYERDLPRPGHADYTAECKYHGFQDVRGGGHFSGRLTAPIVAAGAIALAALEEKGISIGTHIATLDKDLSDAPLVGTREECRRLASEPFPVLDASVKEAMIRRIEAVAKEGDSVGGVLETVVLGIPAGVGEPWFDSVESLLSHALFSIPAIKGISFGSGFAMAGMRGSEANDAFAMRNGDIVTLTNHNGGINGGITNGMPLRFFCAVKPTPSIYKEQSTVSLSKRCDCSLTVQGRHDPAIVHRARSVVEAMTALTLCDLLALRYGTDYLAPVQADGKKEENA